MAEQDNTKGLQFHDLSFEQALEHLDEIVRAMETGGLTLAEYMQLFENGLKLARHCSEMLSETELRISRIQTAYGDQEHIAEKKDKAGDEGC